MKLTWLAFLFVALNLRAQMIDTNLTPRVLTREDSVRLALENNLDIKIEQHGPQRSQYLLEGSYGYYDPVFSMESRHRYISGGGGGIDPNTQLPLVSNARYLDTFEPAVGPGLSGRGPFGFGYQLFGDFSHTENVSPTVGDSYDSSIGIALRQPLLKNFWIDDARANIRISRKNLRISEMALRQRIMEVVQNVEVAYYDLISRRDDVKVKEKGLELATRSVEDFKKKEQVGTVAPLDRRQAESQAATARADVLLALRAMLAQENVVRYLIGGNYAEWGKVRPLPAEALLSVPETYNRGESWRKALENRPDFLQAKLEVERQGIVVKLSDNQVLPSIDLVGGYGRNGVSTIRGNVSPTNPPARFGNSLEDITRERLPQYNFGVVLSFPLGNVSARGQRKAEREEVKRLEDVLRQKYETVLGEIDDAIGEAQTQFERIAATREARKFAEEAYEAEQKKLDNGKSTTFQVLQLQRDLITKSGEEISALAEYNKALTRLYFLEGTLLERNKVTVQFK